MTSETQQPVSPERILQLMWGHAAPMIIYAGLRNNVFEELAAGPLTIDRIHAKTGASVRGLKALLNALVGLGLLAKDTAGHYLLTPESAAFLVRKSPSYYGELFRHTYEQLIPNWLGLAEIVRSGKPIVSLDQTDNGTAFFEKFVEALFPLNSGAANALAESLCLPQLSAPYSVLDVAAGSGVWSICLAMKSPQVWATVVDFPQVLTVTRRMLSRFGLTDRFRLVGGDMHTADFGKDHQIAILGHILHSEGEMRSRELLAKTYQALAPGGTIAIAEFLVNEDRTSPPHALIFAVNMLVHTEQGDTYSFNEIRRWLEEVGFQHVRSLDVPAASPLILATKPPT
ncbi:methylase involved in ubiquinone/menaquinone biosynthesis [Chthonomonas calidirosea]|uniref:Methylase involved in ubiquinone/menaquinone biosynthesis n=1 Tax=Chthonomonas calidirosea (strain DSM 23976 / ICMP 18418 / T49) TaxID=1303518 RepID=S0ETX5_CHTCT|nr:methyltransferase [Chthonomonas calidirosea]CCW34999.1 Methylase involved in ubiquinone/menaquinone biosynthesis [Chthonomonas calidirosea T49]CEK20986.1 methylase involved in ubiquinone/menaquinone biosynthesis [Chthonomonas calidirosea]